MLNQPLDTIDEAALARLIETQVSEGRTLEFKRELPGGGDEDTREFLADITSLANAQGGDVIYGIEENLGVAAALPGVPVDDADAQILRLENKLQSNIDPRLIGVQTHHAPLANGRSAIIIRVRGSLSAPHRVTFKNSGRFWGRNSRGKYELDVHDLRHAFTQSAQLPQQFRQLHAEAIDASQGINMPFAMERAPIAVVSIAPLGLFREERIIPVSRDHAVVPVQRGGYSSIDTIEGVLLHAAPDAEGRVGAYALTHRTGRTDAAFKIGGIRQNQAGQDVKLVWAPAFEQGLLSSANATRMQLRHYGVEGPLIIMASALGVKDHRIGFGYGEMTRPAYRDQVLLGQQIVEDIDDAALMPFAEAFWLLFSRPRPEGRALGAER